MFWKSKAKPKVSEKKGQPVSFIRKQITTYRIATLVWNLSQFKKMNWKLSFKVLIHTMLNNWSWKQTNVRFKVFLLVNQPWHISWANKHLRLFYLSPMNFWESSRNFWYPRTMRTLYAIVLMYFKICVF